jgi:hypothetical protein
MAAMRAAAIAMLIATACSSGGGDGGSAPAPSAPIASSSVSGASPFAAACGTGPGTVYVNSEVEPAIAVDPLNANHWVGVWQQDRWSTGSARGIVTAVTFDAGATWTTRPIAFSVCAGGELARATDPWITFAPDGTAYQSAIAMVGDVFGAASVNAILVSRSRDGGITWSAPATLIRDGAAAFNDKETATADPTDARFAYVVWDRITPQNTGPTWFARTTDGGATWEPARVIYDPGVGAQTIGNLIRVLPDGTLVNLAAHLIGSDESFSQATLEVVRSTDHGATWSAPIRVSDFRPLGARDPVTQQAIRDGSIIPEMAVAPDGTLYVVWQDGRFTQTQDSIALARSTDGGRTWSAPVRVNGAPAAAAFTPQVHVLADGTVGVAYFDLRSNTPDPATLLTDYWLARSADGLTWTDTHIDGPFDIATAPLVGGALFLGDYMGLASSGGAFVSFYARTIGDPANRTDIFAKRIAATAESGVAAKAAGFDARERDPDFDRRSFDNLKRAVQARAMR